MLTGWETQSVHYISIRGLAKNSICHAGNCEHTWDFHRLLQSHLHKLNKKDWSVWRGGHTLPEDMQDRCSRNDIFIHIVPSRTIFLGTAPPKYSCLMSLLYDAWVFMSTYINPVIDLQSFCMHKWQTHPWELKSSM